VLSVLQGTLPGSTPKALESLLGDIVLKVFTGGQSEDCLYLDLYVPGKALKHSKKKLPVIVWIYGGGYSELLEP